MTPLPLFPQLPAQPPPRELTKAQAKQAFVKEPRIILRRPRGGTVTWKGSSRSKRWTAVTRFARYELSFWRHGEYAKGWALRIYDLDDRPLHNTIWARGTYMTKAEAAQAAQYHHDELRRAAGEATYL